jgi:hypothetical protein
MSRSYRALWAVAGYGWGGKRLEKRWANRRVRHTADVPNGKAYRKVYESWEITDYRFPLRPGPYWCQYGQCWKPGTPLWKLRMK